VKREDVDLQRTSDFIEDLQQQGVRLWIDGEQLRVRAPQGTLDPAFRAVLSERKAELIEYLRGRRPMFEVTADAQRRHASFPLTDLQQCYWLGQTDAFDLGNVNPHVYSEFEFTELDLSRVRSTLRRMIRRHDMLRSVVLPSGDQAVLEQTPEWDFPCGDLTMLDEASQQRVLESVRDEMMRTFKTADTWPLFDVRAHRLPAGRIRFHVSLSLLVIDGASVRILGDEIRALYRNPDAELEPQPSLYRDYVLAAAAFKDTASYRRQEAYWRERELAPGPELPLAAPLASVRRPFLKRRSAHFDAETWAGFREHARALGIFHESALCAAYCAVLGRWSKSPKFTLNVLDTHRSTLGESVASVIGNYTVTTLTAVDTASAQPFAELARQVQARRLLDRQNAAVSGVAVLRELNRMRGTASSASVPVVFNNIESVLESDEDVLSDQVLASVQTPQVMLDHMVVGRGRELELHWDALDEVFPDGLIDTMFEAYRTLVTRLSTDASAWNLPLHALIAAAPHLQPAPTHALDALHDARLGDEIWRALERSPDGPAVVDPAGTLSYRELLAGADLVARWLKDRDAEPGRPVAVVMNKGSEQVMAVLGIHEARGAYLPIDAQLPDERIRQLLDRGDVRLVVTQRAADRRIDWPPGVERLAIDAAERRGRSEAPPARLPAGGDAGDLAYVIFTSGSTGEPKGVMIDHRSALNTIDDINRRFGVTGADRVLAISSLGFDLSVYDLFGILGAGGTVVMPDSEDARDPERLATWLRTERITIWNSVPATMELLIEHLEARGERLPASLRLVMLSGDWIPVTLPGRIHKLGPQTRVVSLGGATEASIWSIVYPIDRVAPCWKSIPYGFPLANQRIDVLNDALERCPTWVAGELYIAGAGLALGYFGDPAQTAARFVVHPRSGERLYRTGDWGKYLPDGNIEFLGRDDLQVKIQGFRIELGEIEAVLGRHPAVRIAVVSVVQPGRSGKQLAAYVVPKQADLEVAEVRAFLSARLPPYMVPTFITVLPELPLTSNGKVDRRRLPAPAVRTAAGRVEPSSALEAELRTMWEEVLRRKPIGITDDFFELGGNSLAAVRLCVLVEQKLSRRLSVSQLLRASTIAGMAELLSQAPARVAECLLPIRVRASCRSLILVHPVGGSIVCYRTLAERLSDFSVYGLQARESAAEMSIEQMAAHYLGELRAAGLGPPWLLGGWSMGGILAAELAAQIAQSGEAVDGVVLLDSLLPPEGAEPGEPWLVQQFLADLGEHPDLCSRGAGWARESVPEVALERVLPELHSASLGVERLVSLFRLFAQNQRALARHTLKPVPAPLLLVRAEQQQAFDGWRYLGSKMWEGSRSVDEYSVDASHFTLLNEPTLGHLAARVATFLADCRAGE
jgi:amino acid adenylation domain-containing protein